MSDNLNTETSSDRGDKPDTAGSVPDTDTNAPSGSSTGPAVMAATETISRYYDQGLSTIQMIYSAAITLNTLTQSSLQLLVKEGTSVEEASGFIGKVIKKAVEDTNEGFKRAAEQGEIFPE